MRTFLPRQRVVSLDRVVVRVEHVRTDDGLTHFPGEPEPSIPEDLPSCPTCGDVALVLIEELVTVEGDGLGTS
jgi:hypothetical protein